MELARVTAKRSTCLRRHVGAVLLDFRGHVLATGYNGVASGLPHCNQEESMLDGDGVFHVYHPHSCTGAYSPSGTNLDGCQAIHAEQNALLQCRNPYAIDTCYTTCSPCMTCIKLLLNTTCKRLVFDEEYPHSEALALWTKAGRRYEILK
jgi:dCMP deaminase